MNRSAEKVEKSEKVGTKKPYESPKLFVYGSLAEMTRVKGKHGKLDNRGADRRRPYTGA
jgi:hypothetical protein